MADKIEIIVGQAVDPRLFVEKGILEVTDLDGGKTIEKVYAAQRTECPITVTRMENGDIKTIQYSFARGRLMRTPILGSFDPRHRDYPSFDLFLKGGQS